MSLTFCLQALLARHEAYILNAELERRQIDETIEQLEKDKVELENRNAKTIEENRGLLDQLEALNNDVADSDAQIKSLNATLLSTQQELHRLAVLSSRTNDLEAQLSDLEQERESLRQDLATSKEDEKSAMQRWQRAERMLCGLQDQLEKIEQESHDERERHVEVVGRLERRRVVEKELESAAGRLKGAAAASTLGQGNHGSSVVSHFVKDILQDNANLQLGIVELRDLLSNSNDEVQILREQLILHRPLSQGEKEEEKPQTLDKEVGLETPRSVSQELHVHHHYHAPPNTSERPKERTPIKRPKKKRIVITPAIFQPPRSDLPSPLSSSYPIRPTPPSTATAILSQTSVTVPPNTPPSNHRWSTLSNKAQSTAASSVPSSPQSLNHVSVFDRPFADINMDSSRPTSPDSSVASPTFLPYHSKRSSVASTRSFTAPVPLSNDFNGNNTSRILDSTVEEVEEDGDITDLDIAPTGYAMHAERSPSPPLIHQPLHRSSSHESLLSIHGMDIHTTPYTAQSLRHRPSQLTVRTSTPSTALAATFGTARPSRPSLPSKGSAGWDSSAYNRSLLSSQPQTLKKKSSIGGWISSRWGITPLAESPPSAIPIAPPPSASASSPHDSSSPNATTKAQSIARPPLPKEPTLASLQWGGGGRTPGVNQVGPVPGLWKPKRLPREVVIVKPVDQTALGESLVE
jgi:hypothetical protein